MANNTRVDLGYDDTPDADFDGFGMDGLDWDIESQPDNRKPVEIVADQVKKGAIEKATDEYHLEEVARKSLPKEFTAAFDDVNDLRKEATDTISGLTSDVKKEVIGLQRAAAKLTPTIERHFGKRGGSFWEKLTKTEDQWAPNTNEISEEDSNVMSQIQAVFGEQAKAQAEQKAASDVANATREVIRNEEDKKRFDTSLGVQGRIVNALNQMVGYQQTVDIRFKRSTIESQQRTLYTLRKILEVNTTLTNGAISELKAITKNTALPDILKAQTSENFRQMGEDKLLGAVHERASDISRNYMGSLVKNSKKKAAESFEEVKGFIRDLTDMVDTYADMAELEAEVDGMEGGKEESPRLKAIKFVSKQVGSMAVSAGMKKIGLRFLKEMEKHPDVINATKNLKYFTENKAAIIDNFIQENSYSSGWRGTAARLIGAVAPSIDENRTGAVHNLEQDATHPVAWDLLSRRTLVEIIPEWFSRLDAGIRSLVTGKEQERLMYDHRTESTRKRSDVIADVRRNFVDDSSKEFAHRKIDSILDVLDPKKEMDERSRYLLKRSFLERANNSLGFHTNDWTDGTNLTDEATPEERAELIKKLRGAFKMDRATADGNWLVTSAAESRNKIASLFNDLNRGIVDADKTMQRYQGVGGKDLLREAGFISQKDGKDDFNHKRFVDAFFEDDKTDRPRLPNKGGKPIAGFKSRPVQPNEPTQGGDIVVGEVDLSETSMDRLVKKLMGAKLSSERAQEEQQKKEGDNTFQDGVFSRLDESNQNLLDIKATLLQVIGVMQQQHSEIVGEKVNSFGEFMGSFVHSMKSGGKGIGRAMLKPFQFIKRQSIRTKNFVMNLAKKVTAPARALIKFGTEAGKTFIGMMKGVSDIYRVDRPEPLILGRDIDKGMYVDVKTQKVIRSIEDITGAVKDLNGNFAITEEDFNAGLEVRGIGGRIGYRVGGLVRGAFDRANRVGGAMFRLAGRVMHGATELFSQGLDGVSSFLDRAMDIYVKGEASPRLLRSVMLAGGYYDKATGKVIRSLKDITGDVVDAKGNIVLTVEELKEGIYDKFGKKIDITKILSGIGRVVNGVKDLAFSPFKLFGKGIDKVREMLGNQALKALFLKLPDNVILKANVVNLIDGNKKRKVRGDKDGDGDRDGSWRDQMAKKVNHTDKMKKAAKETGKEKSEGRGMLGILMAGLTGLGTVISKLTDGIGSLGGLLGKGLTGAGDLLTSGAGKVGGKGGLIRRGAGAVGRGAMKLGGAVLKAGGGAVGVVAKAAPVVGSAVLGGASAIASGAAAVGSAALGFVSSPLVLGAAAVLAVGYIGYSMWGYFDRRRDMGTLEKLRFIQYGVDPNVEDFMVGIRYLEGELMGEIKSMRGSIDIPMSAEEVWEEYAEDFGYENLENQEAKLSWCRWYNYRFKPVYLSWVALTSGYKDKDGDSFGLADLDSELPVDKIVEFATKAMGFPSANDPMSINGMPFNGHSTMFGRRDADTYLAFLKETYPTTLGKKTGGSLTVKDKALLKKSRDAKGINDTMTQNVQPKEKETSYVKKAMSFAERYKMGMGSSLLTLPKKSTEQKTAITHIERVRYYQYGANLSSDAQVSSLQELEKAVYPFVRFDGRGRATVDVNMVDLIGKVGGAFGIVDGNEEDKLLFKSWFNFRFLPIFVRLCRILHDANKNLDNYQAKLDGESQIVFIYNQIATRLDTEDGHVPFETAISPWKGWNVPINPADLSAFIEREVGIIKIANGVKDEKLKDIKAQRVQSFVNRTQQRGGSVNSLASNGLPALNMFGQNTHAAMSDMQKGTPIDFTNFKTSGIALVQGGGDGTPLPHDITDDIEKNIARFDGIIARASKKYGVDQNLIRSVIRQESHGKPDAVSHVGAKGLMQFMPATAKDMGIIDPFDPEQNIFGGAKYLRMLLKRYDNNVELALASYNGGMGNVDKAIKIAGSKNGGMVLSALPRVTGKHAEETQGYVRNIVKDYAKRTKQTPPHLLHQDSQSNSVIDKVAAVPSKSTGGVSPEKVDITQSTPSQEAIDDKEAKETKQQAAVASKTVAAKTAAAQTHIAASTSATKVSIDNMAAAQLAESQKTNKTLTNIERMLSEYFGINVNPATNTPTKPKSQPAREAAPAFATDADDMIPVSMGKRRSY